MYNPKCRHYGIVATSVQFSGEEREILGLSKMPVIGCETIAWEKLYSKQFKNSINKRPVSFLSKM